MPTNELRKRFSMLLKEMHRKYGGEKSSTDFYNSLNNLRQESVSKISNDKQAIKDVMIMELLQMDDDISLEWLFTGKGAMFKTDGKMGDLITEIDAYHARVLLLEAKMDKMEALLQETLKLTKDDLVNRGLLK